MLLVLFSASCGEAGGALPPEETWPLNVTLSYTGPWLPGDRIAVGIYDAPGKVGGTEYLYMSGQENAFTLSRDLASVAAPTVYVVAYRDLNDNYEIDSGEPFVVSAAIDLTTGTGSASLTFDETNLWP